MQVIFKPIELDLHLLNFNLQVLREGVLELARTIRDDKDFDIAIIIFPRQQREILVEARRHGNLEAELGKILGFPSKGDVERF